MVLLAEKLLTPGEVAELFRVDPKTVTRWEKAGKVSSIRTLGGHRRYRESEIKELLHPSVLLSIDLVAQTFGVTKHTIRTSPKYRELNASQKPDGIYYKQGEVNALLDRLRSGHR